MAMTSESASNGRVDLRSDIVAPAPANVVRAMANAAARAGEFTWYSDILEQQLEERVCKELGTESAVLFPTCTAANLAALAAVGAKDRTIIAERDSHIVRNEYEGVATLFSSKFALFTQHDGKINDDELADALASDACVVCLENTHNRLGGQVMDPGEISRVARIAHERGIPLFLDGSRLWNAAAALEVSPARIAASADLVSVSFNKGLAAPNGAALAGSKHLVAAAASYWRIIGGLLRPNHVLAAGALAALDGAYMLQADHQVAAEAARAIADIEGFEVVREPTTNILLVSGKKAGLASAALAEQLSKAGIDCLAFGPEQVRLVFHRGVPPDAPIRLREAFGTLAKR